jgi:hypothetical protein
MKLPQHNRILPLQPCSTGFGVLNAPKALQCAAAGKILPVVDVKKHTLSIALILATLASGGSLENVRRMA